MANDNKNSFCNNCSWLDIWSWAPHSWSNSIFSFVTPMNLNIYTFFSFGKLIDFKYAAAAKDDAKISSWNISVALEVMGRKEVMVDKVLQTWGEKNHELTSPTFRPSVSNFLPYCFLDFVELLVTKTNLLPWRKRNSRNDHKRLIVS